MADEVTHEHVEDVGIDGYAVTHTGYSTGHYSALASHSTARAQLFVDIVARCSYTWLAMINHVKFVSIPVSDQQRALDFYTKRLGFEVFTDQPFGEGMRWIELKIGRSETKVVLFTADEHKQWIGKPLNISFKCDNVEKTVAELRERGVEFEGEPQKFHWGWHAQFKDPDGNTFALSD